MTFSALDNVEERLAAATLQDGATLRPMQHVALAQPDGQCHFCSPEFITSLFARTQHYRRINLWLYGAGHISQALVRLLAEMPIDITWIDTHAAFMPADIPHNVRVRIGRSPLEMARSAPASAHHRILTHDHRLDYALCRELLDTDFASLGVSGSRSKAVRLHTQLKRDGVAPDRVAALLCPIGIQTDCKQPTAIAIGIVSQLLQQTALSTAPESTQASFHVDRCNNTHCGAYRAGQTS